MAAGCQGRGDPQPPLEARRAALSTCDRQFSISFPAGVNRDSVVLGSTASLTVRDGVLLNEPSSGSAPISNVGGAALEIGAEARTGGVTSVGAVVLRDRVRVEGSVRSSGTITRGNGVVITGAVSPGVGLTPFVTTTWSICLPASTNDVSMEPDTLRVLAPGSYGALNVKSRARLSLASGTYTFRTITIEPDAKLLLDKTNGPIALYASDSVIYRGTLVDQGGNPDDLFVGYAGTQDLFLGGSFRGTIVAPAGRILLTTVPGGFTGTFLGRNIEAQARLTITHRPFPAASWDIITHLPGSGQGPGAPPSQMLAGRVLHNPPPLTTPAQVPAFVDWASFSTADEREDARAVIQGAAGRDDVAHALSDHFRGLETIDHGRALVTLSILGEMRNPIGEAFLTGYIHEPLPTQDSEGPFVGGEGENAFETAKATLQAKAVTGLAYRASDSAFDQVLWAVGWHASRIVRAEAISAFLAWYPTERGGLAAARQILREQVRPDEQAFIDRIRRVPGESASAFNTKLASFLQLHPELVPPPPVKNTTPPPAPPPPKPLRRIPIF